MAGLAGLESQTGMKLFNAGGRFNFSDQDEDGLERIGLTFSAGAPIRTAVIGLSEKFSLQPLRRLVNFFNCEIVLEINVQKEPNISAQLEKLVNTGFDLLLVAGGVNNGPERALKAVINNLRLLVQLRGGRNALRSYMPATRHWAIMPNSNSKWAMISTLRAISSRTVKEKTYPLPIPP